MKPPHIMGALFPSQSLTRWRKLKHIKDIWLFLEFLFFRAFSENFQDIWEREANCKKGRGKWYIRSDTGWLWRPETNWREKGRGSGERERGERKRKGGKTVIAVSWKFRRKGNKEKGRQGDGSISLFPFHNSQILPPSLSLWDFYSQKIFHTKPDTLSWKNIIVGKQEDFSVYEKWPKLTSKYNLSKVISLYKSSVFIEIFIRYE